MNIEDELKILAKEGKEQLGVIEEEPVDVSIGISRKNKETKKSKKAKKKEKGTPLSNKLDGIIGDIEALSPVNKDYDMESITEIAKEIKKNTKKRGEKLEFDSDKFMDGEGKKRKTHNELVKQYLKMFRNESALTLALLKESDTDTKLIRQALHTMLEHGTVRGVMGKVTTDLASVLMSGNSNRLAIIKQLSEFTKLANDMAFKEESRKKNDDGMTFDPEMFGAAAMKSMFSQSTRDLNATVSQANAMSDAEFEALRQRAMQGFTDEGYPMGGAPVNDIDTKPVISDDGNTLPRQAVARDPVQFDQDMETHMRELEDGYRESGENIYLRSEAGDNMIANEARGVKVKIRRHLDESTGEYDWEFIAVDKNDIVVDSYEVPDKAKTRISWNDSSGFAKDNLGRVYEVIDA